MEGNRKLVKEFRCGDVRAMVWLQKSNGRRGYYTATISRWYPAGDQMKSTPSLRFEDLMNIRKVARRAHFWIWWKGGAFYRKRR